jgi:hypothetical protein
MADVSDVRQLGGLLMPAKWGDVRIMMVAVTTSATEAPALTTAGSAGPCRMARACDTGFASSRSPARSTRAGYSATISGDA